MTDLKQSAIELMRSRGLEHREEPFRLASGELSHDYIDGKHAVDSGARLALVAQAITEVAASNDITFDAVGGLTMGADAVAIGVAIHASASWFSVRKTPKARGREAWIEGTRLDTTSRVLLVDDIVSMGGSILQAYEKVLDAGAMVVGAIPMVDRGEQGRPLFAVRGVPYHPLMTYQDLGIAPVGGAPVGDTPAPTAPH